VGRRVRPDGAQRALSKWAALLPSAYHLQEEKALDAIRPLPSRQSDAEGMLDRDECDFGDLSRFDLEPTQTICEKARASLKRRVAKLPAIAPQSRPYSDIANDVASATSGMSWLVG